MDMYELVEKQERGETLTAGDIADAVDALFDAMDALIEKLEQEAHMGAFDDIPNIVLPDPDDPEAAALFRKKWKWEPHEQVIMRGAFTAGDQEAIGNASTLTGKKGDLVIQAGTGRLKLLEQMIIDWTFAVGGRKVEVSMRAIKRLPSNYSTPILEKCDELAAALSEEEQEDFLPSANGHTVAHSDEMSVYPSLS